MPLKNIFCSGPKSGDIDHLLSGKINHPLFLLIFFDFSFVGVYTNIHSFIKVIFNRSYPFFHKEGPQFMWDNN